MTYTLAAPVQLASSRMNQPTSKSPVFIYMLTCTWWFAHITHPSLRNESEGTTTVLYTRRISARPMPEPNEKSPPKPAVRRGTAWHLVVSTYCSREVCPSSRMQSMHARMLRMQVKTPLEGCTAYCGCCQKAGKRAFITIRHHRHHQHHHHHQQQQQHAPACKRLSETKGRQTTYLRECFLPTSVGRLRSPSTIYHLMTSGKKT
jgi:ABC-type nickel/cobalt efflux system permease component RcnA